MLNHRKLIGTAILPVLAQKQEMARLMGSTEYLHARDRHPLFRLKLLVLRLFFHVRTLRYQVLHFRFETAYVKVATAFLRHACRDKIGQPLNLPAGDSQ